MSDVTTCSGCAGRIDAGYRFCPWCATPQRRKLVEFFTSHPDMPAERGKALRVSAYVEGARSHLRLSIWRESGRAEATVSLDRGEAGRLARFLRDSLPDAPTGEETEQLPTLHA